MNKQINFNNYKDQMTEEDIQELYELISSGCRAKRKGRILSCLKYGKHMIGTFGILDRLIKENGKWCYVAGQDSISEMRTVRECITGEK